MEGGQDGAVDFTKDVSRAILEEVTKKIRTEERRNNGSRDQRLCNSYDNLGKENGLSFEGLWGSEKKVEEAPPGPLASILGYDLVGLASSTGRLETRSEYCGGVGEWARQRASRPVFSSREPPAGAKAYYKIVRVPVKERGARDGDEDEEEDERRRGRRQLRRQGEGEGESQDPCRVGVEREDSQSHASHDTCFSVFDGETEYRKGVTLYSEARANHAGGFYVYDTVEECLLNHEHFPRRRTSKEGRGGEWRKAIARVVAWNEADNCDSPSLGEAEVVRYGNKKVFSYVRLVELLPFPAGRGDLPSYATTGRASERRLQVIRARAKTISLKEEVDQMEERLRVSRLMSATGGGLGASLSLHLDED
ncbi:hypothetical protein HOP50_12g67930 [Chloropicon primus]|uniref:Uncharacterized protein n=1 Tax=Chloropicon primus TaxID=1764295 RepID=A0A5B8MV73_9CHLO|nr:hypothetical protein A3770_12p67750 [Chloropicon primus]UPR03464.1 hypothetical protein HOP50_12g67930 [Chloropicon primus]|eukprot:QDZ24257.1 hypothetical protein A3770_12p67750 [Chloropicon primus]